VALASFRWAAIERRERPSGQPRNRLHSQRLNWRTVADPSVQSAARNSVTVTGRRHSTKHTVAKTIVPKRVSKWSRQGCFIGCRSYGSPV
jgi:hypothetical protein